jgi:hypothetical protein
MLNKKALFAGLAAVAVGAAVVFFTRSAPPVEVVAAPARPVVAAPFVGPRTKPEAMAALMALPELKAWSSRIETSSKGASHGALIEYGPTPKSIGDKRYWQLSYVENTPDAAHRWESFLVGENTPDILVEDDERGQPLTLDEWRKEKQPLARKSALQ